MARHKTLEDAAEAWLDSLGVVLAPAAHPEQEAARARLAAIGEPERRRALWLVALWGLSSSAWGARAGLLPADIADFIEAEGFTLRDREGARTHVGAKVTT